MRKISSNDDLMTTREAGETLGVAVRTVQLWVEAGILPAWRTAGGHRRIARSAVEKLMRERSQVLTTEPQESKAGAAHHAPLKVLVVEDDPTQLHLYRKMLESWTLPITLATASNGFEGLVRIGQMNPDWVVTDLQMPGMDGFEMLRSLKKSDAGLPALRVIVVSAMSDEEIQNHGGLPADVTFMRKPIHFGKLEALLKSALR